MGNRLLVMGVALGLAGAGCSGRAPATERAVASDVAATVNGAPITEADLELKLKSDMHQTELKPEFRANVIEAVIRDELLAEKAAELGLDKDEAYRAGLRALEAQVTAYRRRQLSDRYIAHALAAAGPTEADGRKFFDAHAGELRTELHIMQILVRDEAAITRAKTALDQGTAFEEVARGLLPNVPAADAPWDMGYLKWMQVPEQWRASLATLKPGDTSGVIRGPRNRFWIIKLVAKRDTPDVTFETLKAPLLDYLKNSQLGEVREAAERDLRARAKIEYLKK